MLSVALEYRQGDRNGFRVYRPARGGGSCERFGEYKTLNRIPLPLEFYQNIFALNMHFGSSYSERMRDGMVSQFFQL